jgi:uncharacterized protein YlzI (FlbEa/FlbD family)
MSALRLRHFREAPSPTGIQQRGLENRGRGGNIARTMPLIKLNRINKGGEIVINSDHILFVEIESRSTTIHMTNNLLFSVEETLDAVAAKVENLELAGSRTAVPPEGSAH